MGQNMTTELPAQLQPASGAKVIGPFAPLAEPTFRRIWLSSLLSNFGQLILGVGAAWEMTRLSGQPAMVALVQTAMMMPLFLVAVPAGALADMFDRRKIALVGLAFSSLSGAVLTTLAFAGMLSPITLLVFCSLIGAGVALYGPSWQASISEQVSEAHLPAAIGLGSISNSIARSFGPALGGLIVLAAGAKTAFAINAIAYLPLWFAFFFWTRRHKPSRLPPERIGRAIVSGTRYAMHSPPIRTVLARAFAFGLAGATYTALGPLIARDLLHGTASTYGLILGATGIGAVVGALLLQKLRDGRSNEMLMRVFALMTGGSLEVIAQSHSIIVTTIAFFLIGVANMQTVSMLNISVQLTAPRWVTARALSLFSSALTGGIAFGAWFWGQVAGHLGVTPALVLSGSVVAGTALLGMLIPLPRAQDIDTATVEQLNEPQVALALTLRSGPMVVELEYNVDPAKAREFYEAALHLQKLRQRNGGFNWSLARDIAEPAIWTERFHCPTWGDYLRMHNRYTLSEINLQREVETLCQPGTKRPVRRWLERPFGSVRWKADSPDPQVSESYLGP
jgi:MFS family permease